MPCNQIFHRIGACPSQAAKPIPVAKCLLVAKMVIIDWHQIAKNHFSEGFYGWWAYLALLTIEGLPQTDVCLKSLDGFHRLEHAR